jgi:hypothetical protein
MELAQWIRPGDGVVFGQACAEPQTLVEALVAQRAAFSGAVLFMGVNWSGTVKPEHADHLRLSAYCGSGHNRALTRASERHRIIRGRRLIAPADPRVVLLQARRMQGETAACRRAPGRHSLMLVNRRRRTPNCCATNFAVNLAPVACGRRDWRSRSTQCLRAEARRMVWRRRRGAGHAQRAHYPAPPPMLRCAIVRTPAWRADGIAS